MSLNRPVCFWIQSLLHVQQFYVMVDLLKTGAI